ncbi:hypothetical protein [Sporosarcina aquimarina]|uniref:Endolytic transglycosylase MltG n=1 Tax=Sporosarcina aquimarina TaxID=114975 RepID=A0ABU4FW62_9BACL|nr:hypothetical protein [Sporosarcina aquimarina]MDW0108949.1 hypothetical protein [Sporosarcina aquimarina]
MIRQILQIIGVVSLTAGAVLFILNEPSSSDKNELISLSAENTKLKQQLTETKEALADAQQTSRSDNTTFHSEKETDSSQVDETKDPITKMILTLSRGDTSKDASDSLERSGIIKSSNEFERYLDDNGLSGKIQIGKHEVDSTMSFAALAKELTTVKQ